MTGRGVPPAARGTLDHGDCHGTLRAERGNSGSRQLEGTRPATLDLVDGTVGRARPVLTWECFLSLDRIWVEPCCSWRDFLSSFWYPQPASSDLFARAATEVPFSEALTTEAVVPDASPSWLCSMVGGLHVRDMDVPSRPSSSRLNIYASR